MKSAPLPPNEDQRLEALRRTGLLDSAPDQGFDDLTRLASAICGTPIALVSLVDADRQWFKSRVGLDAAQTPRDVAFCAHAILEPERPFVVNDALEDERFADNPLVTGQPKVRFYAGMPLLSSEGHGVGTLCVIDHQPRHLRSDQLEALKILQRRVTTLVQLREIGMNAKDLLQRQVEQDRFFSLSLDMLCICGFDGVFRRINPAWEEVLGYTLHELLSRPFLEFVHPDDRESTEAIFGRVLAGNQIKNFENRYRAKDGTWRWFLWNAAPFGEERLVYATARDITVRKLSEQALRESEARHRGTLEAVLDAVITIDVEGTVLSCNPSTESLFGYAAEELMGRNVRQLMPEPHREQHDDYLAKYLETGDSTVIGQRREVPAQRKDGTIFPAELTVSEIAESERKVFTGVVRDITPRKEAERAKDEFLSTVSHELRTPLTSIYGSLGLLEGGVLGEIPPQAVSVLQIARKNSDRLIRLINEILDFEKIQAGRMELRLRVCDSSQLVQDALEGVQGMATERGVSLESQIQADPLVRVDPERVTQVLINLLSNAIKFSDQGSKVRMEMSLDERAWVRIEVSDTGPGIPPEERGKLFQRFQQLDASTQRRVGGTGLGLAICKALVSQHGGQIGVESQVGVGSTFWVSFPSLRAKPSSGRLPLAKPSDKVLLVEDDEDIAQLLRLLVEDEGHQVDRVASLGEAQDYLSEWRPLVVVLDLGLPDGDGSVLLDGLEGSLRERGVPVVIVSGRDSLAEKGFAHPQVIDWLVKPYDEQELLRALRRAVSRHGPARVLVLEDDPDVRKIVVKQLEELGVECLEAADGMEGLKLAREVRPDLLVLDIGLPRLDGFEVVDLLRQELDLSVPLIVYSGRNLSSREMGELKLGVTRFLTKGSATKQQLQKAVRDLLSGLLGASD